MCMYANCTTNSGSGARVRQYHVRMRRRHRIVVDTYRAHRDTYETMFRLCVALTNYHVSRYPLCDDDDDNGE